MALSEEKIKSYSQRILLSRMRILCNHGFYGLLLMHMKFSIDESVETACTDGERIIFGSCFLETLSDRELDFVMMHEIMHVVLQHCMRGEKYDAERFNIACDIVVNSNILLENNKKMSSITLKQYGVSIHLAPDGKEGYEYTAEQVYNMLPKINKGFGLMNGDGEKGFWDNHSKWGFGGDDDLLKDVWAKHFSDAVEAISIRDASNNRNNIPLFAKRILETMRKAQTNWRTILNDFVQEEVVDYSFSPPDRRFAESPFFLPDFNEKDDIVEDILFMIDTSASMSDEMITAAYYEIKGAIDQFNGRLKGWLGFFDAAVIKPQPFADENEFEIIKPFGGGGTNFHIIFEYVRKKMQDKLPVSIIILTDGYAPFPEESISMGIPVLWLLNNEKVNPPWGRIARITV
ncbi:MAG: hypothetical protein E7562_01425 [Ruminococcaceae bacterium]|nr:hypothetical protein [Oscillospiraceae bacterium]